MKWQGNPGAAGGSIWQVRRGGAGAVIALLTALSSAAVSAQEVPLDIGIGGATPAVAVPAESGGASGGSGGGGLGFGDGSTPFELSAGQGIEWRESERTYTARGNAIATQGDSSIAADKLVFYTGADDSSFERILATGSVKVTAGSSTSYGDQGDYDAEQKLLVLTGSNLRMESEGDIITARDRIEYWSGDKAVVAIGDAVVKRQDSEIRGDQAVLYFAANAAGDDELSQIEASGNVKVLNNGQTILGNNFAYNPDTDIAVVTGNVLIIDGENEYRGARAEIDNKNKVSRILAGEGKRVHTFIKPKQSTGGGTAQ
ncbi:lipopolysaccharide export system protein LptA [Dongia mobilis]|uniref:Lipopolysaccharide export system protein LptA n=1 Tax=Dongia mobilis TaxID=578943 RepID=A0A4R6WRH4_9PROT|nr:LptA/OstA family protein [Dongia mobilis]TDQ82127.1 lipopolysaccharide export system protein LptA [Dongia mobilis]